MSWVNREGNFKAKVADHRVNITTNGYPRFEAEFKLTHEWDYDTQDWVELDGSESSTAWMVLFDSKDDPTISAKALVEVMGWSGGSLAELDSMDFSDVECTVNVKENEYNGNVNYNVAFINPADSTPGSAMTKIDKSKIKDLDKKYSKALKGLKGGKPKAAKPSTPKPTVPKKASAKKAPEKKGPPAKSTTVEGITMDEAWDRCVKHFNGDEALASAAWVDERNDGPDDDKMTPEDWAKVAENITGIPF